MSTPLEDDEMITVVFPAAVVHVIDPFKLAINRGSHHSIRMGQRFLVYKLSDQDIMDPTTGESLGRLEIVKGTGKVTHIQEKMSTIESDRKTPAQKTVIRKRNPLSSAWFGEQEEERVSPTQDPLPFEDPVVGDQAKPV
jgi:hypothetical protein